MNKNKENGRHICPVCGKHYFEEYDSFDFCPVCKWHDDALLTKNPEMRGYYRMNLREAREAYEKGEPIQ